MGTELITIPSIVVICYLLSEGIKTTKLDNKYIPIICGVAGGALGIAATFLVPEFPATDMLTAAAIGIVSGLSATGLNQVYKQLVTYNKEKEK